MHLNNVILLYSHTITSFTFPQIPTYMYPPLEGYFTLLAFRGTYHASPK